MKRTLLPLVVLTLLSVQAFAQCTPNPLYNDSLFGAWPDTTENFPPGVVNMFYTDTLNLLLPLDGGDVDPQFAGQMLDSVSLQSITGLPPGLTTYCNSQTGGACTFLAAQLGCVLLEGTPTQIGTYPITISVTAYTSFLGVAIPVPYSFSGYEIVISGGVGINEQQLQLFQNVKNVPNPFSTETEIRFELAKASTVSVKVFDLLGQEVFTAQDNFSKGANALKINGAEFEQGIYIYQLNAAGKSHVGRMVLDR